MAAQDGKPSNSGTSAEPSSQAALLDKKMCAVGSIVTSVSRHPAGTTSKPAIWVLGNAEPHNLQKLLLCRVPGSVKDVTAASPDRQTNLAERENRLAA